MPEHIGQKKRWPLLMANEQFATSAHHAAMRLQNSKRKDTTYVRQTKLQRKLWRKPSWRFDGLFVGHYRAGDSGIRLLSLFDWGIKAQSERSNYGKDTTKIGSHRHPRSPKMAAPNKDSRSQARAGGFAEGASGACASLRLIRRIAMAARRSVVGADRRSGLAIPEGDAVQGD